MTFVEGELAGDVALVTGGSSGIGLAVARVFLRHGARVGIFARDPERLSSAAKSLSEETAGEVVTLEGDVARERDVDAAFSELGDRFGGPDVLVANAGSHHGAPVEDITHADWTRMVSEHAGGTFLLARAGFRCWKRSGRGGRIVVVASKSAVAATPKAAAYAAAKAAQMHLARCLAEEGGPYGIRVNTVLPDGVLRGTGIFTPDQRRKAAERHGVEPGELEAFYARRNALRAEITPEDVAQAVLFFAGKRSRHINGAALTVDGGVSTGYLR